MSTKQPDPAGGKAAVEERHRELLPKLIGYSDEWAHENPESAEHDAQEIADFEAQATAKLRAERDEAKAKAEGWKVHFSGKDADFQEAKRAILLLKEYHETANLDRGRLSEQINDLQDHLAASRALVERLKEALGGLKEFVKDVLLPQINKGIEAGVKMETGIVEAFQWDVIIQNTDTSQALTESDFLPAEQQPK